jgi:CPA1 family monovalent cation:H+ antiporter
MLLFESTLVLLAIAIALTQVSRRFNIPYPTMLATAGLIIAMLPLTIDIRFDPQLALALFIAPVLLDAGFDLPPRTLLRYWLPLISLAAVAVVLTTAAVAWAGMAWAGLALAPAIALGAIVAPPDAAAASAVLSRFELPRNTVTVLKGESLLNDAVSLLIFMAAVGAATGHMSASQLSLRLALAVPGGLLLGVAAGRGFVFISPKLAGTVSGTIAQFVATFFVWIVADRLHLSAILAVVAYAMTIARYAPEQTSARDRVHAYSVWEAAVFLLNVLAFLLTGIQARSIIASLKPASLWNDLRFAAGVVVIVIVVRVVWVMIYNRLRALVPLKDGQRRGPSLAQGAVVAWCGTRGLVTLAAALSLPAAFPSRDLIVLTAFAVVIGTLVGQGLTLGPLVKWLNFKPDGSFDAELSSARINLLDHGVDSFKNHKDESADRLRAIYASERAVSDKGHHPREVTKFDKLRRHSIAKMRQRLADMRRNGEIDDDVFHALEQELDVSELAATPPGDLEMAES